LVTIGVDAETDVEEHASKEIEDGDYSSSEGDKGYNNVSLLVQCLTIIADKYPRWGRQEPCIKVHGIVIKLTTCFKAPKKETRPLLSCAGELHKLCEGSGPYPGGSIIEILVNAK
jgi:hypothetical protein